MTAPPVPAAVESVQLVAGLRVWAAGFPADEAAVDLFVAVAETVPTLLNPAPGPDEWWLVPCPRPGVWSLDGAALAATVDVFPVRMRPVILVAAALAVDGVLVEVGTTLAAVPAEWLGPVFAALAHAAGCPTLRPVGSGLVQPGLFPVLDGAA